MHAIDPELRAADVRVRHGQEGVQSEQDDRHSGPFDLRPLRRLPRAQPGIHTNRIAFSSSAAVVSVLVAWGEIHVLLCYAIVYIILLIAVFAMVLHVYSAARAD